MVDLSVVCLGSTGGACGACLCPCFSGQTALVCRPAGADGVAIARGQYAPPPRYVLVLLRAYARFVGCEQREDLHK